MIKSLEFEKYMFLQEFIAKLNTSNVVFALNSHQQPLTYGGFINEDCIKFKGLFS